MQKNFVFPFIVGALAPIRPKNMSPAYFLNGRLSCRSGARVQIPPKQKRYLRYPFAGGEGEI